MSSIFNLQTYSIKTIYQYFQSHKTKDKIDMILEPLHSMIQLSLLGISPIGSKLTIQENILYLQAPNIIQPVVRWYNSDKKDDVYFLFQVIQRFIKWYNPQLNKKSPVSAELYQLIVNMSVNGLNNLLKTYSTNESNAVQQVLNMYKNLLDTNNIQYHIDEKNDKNDKHDKNDKNEEKINIDEVFENIRTIYDQNTLNIIYNSLVLLEAEQDETDVYTLINGLNLMLNKINKKIREWIKVNLVF
jgi:ribosome-associated translation inhibitor RaiA